jgi:hypothetical protein
MRLLHAVIVGNSDARELIEIGASNASQSVDASRLAEGSRGFRHFPEAP